MAGVIVKTEVQLMQFMRDDANIKSTMTIATVVTKYYLLENLTHRMMNTSKCNKCIESYQTLIQRDVFTAQYLCIRNVFECSFFKTSIYNFIYFLL